MAGDRETVFATAWNYGKSRVHKHDSSFAKLIGQGRFAMLRMATPVG